MARTRSGQGGGQSGSQNSRGRPRSGNRPPPIIEDGNSSPAPVTLEAIQKLLLDQQVQNRAEMNDLINERLQELSKTLTHDAASGSVHPSHHSPTHESHHTARHSPSPPPQNPPPPNPSGPRCTFKDFMVCRPKEFHGGKDPKVTMHWLAEIEQVLRVCRCEEDMKVTFAEVSADKIEFSTDKNLADDKKRSDTK